MGVRAATADRRATDGLGRRSRLAAAEGRTDDPSTHDASSASAARRDAVAGTLVVVATPIGNLGDLSARATQVLREVDLILAEDTRHTGRLLAHIGSQVPQRSLHEHNEQQRTAEVLARLATGERIALVSDAGTPAVSDPGYRLVAACVAAGLRVEPVPGPSAVLAALVASGLPTDRFAFDGFLPRKGRARRQRLAELAFEPRTIVLFAAPHRVGNDLEDLAAALGPDRPAALGRELTKLHEEVRHGTLATLGATAGEGVRGEVTLVIAGAPTSVLATPQDHELAARVAELVAAGSVKKDAIAEVARTAGVPKRTVYQAVLDSAEQERT
jgi:16S rRNA (cytidine1402-2'-O)-methyltransferase